MAVIRPNPGGARQVPANSRPRTDHRRLGRRPQRHRNLFSSGRAVRIRPGLGAVLQLALDVRDPGNQRPHRPGDRTRRRRRHSPALSRPGPLCARAVADRRQCHQPRRGPWRRWAAAGAAGAWAATSTSPIRWLHHRDHPRPAGDGDLPQIPPLRRLVSEMADTGRCSPMSAVVFTSSISTGAEVLLATWSWPQHQSGTADDDHHWWSPSSAPPSAPISCSGRPRKRSRTRSASDPEAKPLLERDPGQARKPELSTDSHGTPIVGMASFQPDRLLHHPHHGGDPARGMASHRYPDLGPGGGSRSKPIAGPLVAFLLFSLGHHRHRAFGGARVGRISGLCRSARLAGWKVGLARTSCASEAIGFYVPDWSGHHPRLGRRS